MDERAEIKNISQAIGRPGVRIFEQSQDTSSMANILLPAFHLGDESVGKGASGITLVSILCRCPFGAGGCFVGRRLPFEIQIDSYCGHGLKGIAWISSLFSWDSEVCSILKPYYS